MTRAVTVEEDPRHRRSRRRIRMAGRHARRWRPISTRRSPPSSTAASRPWPWKLLERRPVERSTLRCRPPAASTRENWDKKSESARVERGESEDTFVWMSVSSRRKNTIRVLAADWSNDRRCESRPSKVQLCTVFFICCLKTVRHKK
jgi:hypothetical protein